ATCISISGSSGRTHASCRSSLPFHDTVLPFMNGLIIFSASSKRPTGTGSWAMYRRAESPRPMPITIRPSEMSCSVAYALASTVDSVVSVLLAVAAPAVAVVLWGTFAAPKATRRLADAARVPFELAVFALAAAALAAAGNAALALAFAALVVVNAALLTTFR